MSPPQRPVRGAATTAQPQCAAVGAAATAAGHGRCRVGVAWPATRSSTPAGRPTAHAADGTTSSLAHGEGPGGLRRGAGTSRNSGPTATRRGVPGVEGTSPPPFRRWPAPAARGSLAAESPILKVPLRTTSADCGARRGDWLGSGGRCHPGQRSTEQTTPGWQAAPAAAAGPTVSGACDGRPGSTSPEARSTEPPQLPLGRPTRRPSSPFPTLPPLGWERGQPTGKGQTPSRRTVLEATHRGGRRRSATQLGSSPRGGPITGRPRGGGALLCPHGLSRGKGPAGDVGAPSYNADLGPCGDRAKATRSTAAAAEGAVPGQRSGHVGHGGLSRRGHSACLLTTAHCHRDGSSIGSTPTIEERLFKRLYAEARSHLTLALADSGTDAWRCCRH